MLAIRNVGYGLCTALVGVFVVMLASMVWVAVWLSDPWRFFDPMAQWMLCIIHCGPPDLAALASLEHLIGPLAVVLLAARALRRGNS
jgi:hypothetical protein